MPTVPNFILCMVEDVSEPRCVHLPMREDVRTVLISGELKGWGISTPRQGNWIYLPPTGDNPKQQTKEYLRLLHEHEGLAMLLTTAFAARVLMCTALHTNEWPPEADGALLVEKLRRHAIGWRELPMFVRS